jgi:hypothetical protein
MRSVFKLKYVQSLKAQEGKLWQRQYQIMLLPTSPQVLSVQNTESLAVAGCISLSLVFTEVTYDKMFKSDTNK